MFGRISGMEIKWLDSLKVPINYRQKTIKINGRIFKTDAADVENKIIWEFYGDFWHGNLQRYNPHETNKPTKKTFTELYAKTMAREKSLRDAGYTVISIWESDFVKLQKTMQP